MKLGNISVVHSSIQGIFIEYLLSNTELGAGNVMGSKANLPLVSWCIWFSGWREAFRNYNKIWCTSVFRAMENPARMWLVDLSWLKLRYPSLPWKVTSGQKRSGNLPVLPYSFPSHSLQSDFQPSLFTSAQNPKEGNWLGAFWECGCMPGRVPSRNHQYR